MLGPGFQGICASMQILMNVLISSYCHKKVSIRNGLECKMAASSSKVSYEEKIITVSQVCRIVNCLYYKVTSCDAMTDILVYTFFLDISLVAVQLASEDDTSRFFFSYLSTSKQLRGSRQFLGAWMQIALYVEILIHEL